MARQPIAPVSLAHPEPSPDGGRPTKLTDALAARIITAIRLGAHRGPAAAWAGVPHETMSRWMHRDGEPYASFAERVRQAEAHAELRLVGIATNTNDARDAIAFLERRFPQRWARVPTQTLAVTVDLGRVLDAIEQRRADPRTPRDPRPPRVIEHEPRALPESSPAALPEHEPRPKREPLTRPPRTPVR